VIGSLQSKIDILKEDRTVHFQCRPETQALFTNPPLRPIEEYDMTEEEVARMEELLTDKARKRLTFEMGCQIVKFPQESDIGQFVALKAPEDRPEPFYIAQVLQNFTDMKKMKIHWYEPTAASRSRTSKYEDMYYQEEMDRQKLKRRQQGRLTHRLIPRIDEIEYDTIHFGFTKLKESGGMHSTVLRQLRLLGIITGKIKRT
jgi:hypothetical protein